MNCTERLVALFQPSTFMEWGLHADHDCHDFGLEGKSLPGDGVVGFSSRPAERRSLALQLALEHYNPATDDKQFLNDAERAVYVEAFQNGGFTGPINWYRNFTRNWERSEPLPRRIDGIPCLMIMAEHDVVLPPSLADRMGDQIEDLEKVLVEGSGHWTQQEKPQAVNAAIVDWLVRRFGR